MSDRRFMLALVLTVAASSSCARRATLPGPTQAPGNDGGSAPSSAQLDLTPLEEDEAERFEELDQAMLEATWPSLHGGSDPVATQALDRAIAERVGLDEWQRALGSTIPAESMTRIECRSALATQHVVSIQCERTIDGYDDQGDPIESTTRWSHTLVFRSGQVHEARWREMFADPEVAEVLARRMVERDTLLAAAGLDDPAFSEVERTVSDYVDHCGFDFGRPQLLVTEEGVELWSSAPDEPCIASATAVLAELMPAVAPDSLIAALGAHLRQESPELWAEEEELAQHGVLPLWPPDQPLASPRPTTTEPVSTDTVVLPCDDEVALARIARAPGQPPAWLREAVCDDGSTLYSLLVELDGELVPVLEEWNAHVEVHPGLGGEVVVVDHDCCCQHTVQVHGLRAAELLPLQEDSGCYDHDACTTLVAPELVTEHGRVVSLRTPRDCDDPHGASKQLPLDMRYPLHR